MPIFQFLPGVGTLKQAAEGERVNLDKTRETFNDKYDWGDHLRGMLGGYTKEEVLKEAAKLENDAINTKLTNERNSARIALDGTGLAPTSSTRIGTGQKVEDFRADLATDTARGSYAQQYLDMPGADPSDFNPTDSVASIRSKGSQLRSANTQKVEDKADTRYYDMLEREAQRRQDDREDRRAERADNREIRLLELNQSNKRRKSELFQALFGLGSAFMI